MNLANKVFEKYNIFIVLLLILMFRLPIINQGLGAYIIIDDGLNAD